MPLLRAPECEGGAFVLGTSMHHVVLLQSHGQDAKTGWGGAGQGGVGLFGNAAAAVAAVAIDGYMTTARHHHQRDFSTTFPLRVFLTIVS